MSETSHNLSNAYRQARYRVLAEPSFVLHIDQYSPELVGWHAANGIVESAFLTAANPRSQLLEAEENRTRHEQLVRLVDGFPTEPGRAEDPQGHWPDEPGLLIGGLTLVEARELARQFGQNALVYAGSDTRPYLVWASD